VPHCLQADGGYVTIFVDPYLRAVAGLVRGLAVSACWSFCPRSAKAQSASSGVAYSPIRQLDDVRHTVDRIIQFLTPGAIDIPELDFRVQTVVNELIADSSEHVSLQTFAASVRCQRAAWLICSAAK
jgi:hypothetical protein